MKKKIALLAGGYSGEYAISIGSAATVEKWLDGERYDIYKIVITRDGWRFTTADGTEVEVDKNDFSLLLPGGKVTFDAVFIAVHGTPGEDGRLQGYLDMLGIPYTGCNAIVSALTFNKSYCNGVVKALGAVGIADSVQLVKGQPYSVGAILDVLKLPVFVKPSESGSSLGVSKVKKVEELLPAIELAFREDKQVLIEEAIVGRELSIGVYRTAGLIQALPPTEIQTDREFFDYEAKYTAGASQELTPAPVSEEVLADLEKKATYLYAQLSCRGIVRMDFILQEKTSKLFFLEVNTMPGQSEASIVPQQVRQAGLTLTRFYGDLLEEALREGAML